MDPYWTDGQVTLYCGDFREILPALALTPDLVMADPPYGETGLAWDRWPVGWPEALAATGARSMWCFGSMRMFLDRRDEFAAWRFSHDAVWEKNTGSGATADRLRRVHENATHWYRGDWGSIYHQCPRTPHDGPFQGSTPRAQAGVVHRSGGDFHGEWVDDGTRQVRSVIHAASLRGRAVNPTEKPQNVLQPLIEYGCPPGGLVVDIFGGSCSTLVAARDLGRRAVAIEAREDQCEKAVRHRLAVQAPLLMDWSA